MEAVRPGSAFEGNTPLLVDHVQAVWPAGIRFLCCVFDVVEQCRDFDLEPTHTGVGHGLALGVGLRVGVNDALPLVDGELPAIARMRFLDVDDEELGAIFVLAVEIVEGGNLPPERRSSVAAEDEDDGAPGEVAQFHAAGLVMPGEIEIGCCVAGGQRATARDCPGCSKRKTGHHYGAGNVRCSCSKLIWWQPHDGEQASGDHQVDGNQADDGSPENSHALTDAFLYGRHAVDEAGFGAAQFHDRRGTHLL